MRQMHQDSFVLAADRSLDGEGGEGGEGGESEQLL